MCYDKMSGSGQIVKPIDYTSEHETVKSRLTGHDVEIEFSPMGAAADPSKGGKVGINPFASRAQAAYLHMHPSVLGETALAEWDRETKGKHIPKHVKK